jgi:hypothetical protein
MPVGVFMGGTLRGVMAYCILIMALVLTAESIGLCRNPLGAAKILFKKHIKDFGAVFAGEKLKFSFEFMNVGSETLEIYSLVPS